MEISISVVNALAVYKIATKKKFRELLSAEKIIRIIYRRSDKYKFYARNLKKTTSFSPNQLSVLNVLKFLFWNNNLTILL